MAEQVKGADILWRQVLSPEEYAVLREAGTEKKDTCEYRKEQPTPGGYYSCRACNLPLYKANHKLISACGWPAFGETIRADCVTKADCYRKGYYREESKCGRCDSHLGHRFDESYGTRYCMNGVCLNYYEDTPIPELPAEGQLAMKPDAISIKDILKGADGICEVCESCPVKARAEHASTVITATPAAECAADGLKFIVLPLPGYSSPNIVDQYVILPPDSETVPKSNIWQVKSHNESDYSEGFKRELVECKCCHRTVGFRFYSPHRVLIRIH